MDIAEQICSNAYLLVKHCVGFIKTSYHQGHVITADGKKFIMNKHDNNFNQLMKAFIVAKSDKNEHLILPTAVVDFVACQLYIFKHTKEGFEKADMAEVRKIFGKIMTPKHQDLVFMILNLVFGEIGEFILEQQDNELKQAI